MLTQLYEISSPGKQTSTKPKSDTDCLKVIDKFGGRNNPRCAEAKKVSGLGRWYYSAGPHCLESRGAKRASLACEWWF